MNCEVGQAATPFSGICVEAARTCKSLWLVLHSLPDTTHD